MEDCRHRLRRKGPPVLLMRVGTCRSCAGAEVECGVSCKGHSDHINKCRNGIEEGE